MISIVVPVYNTVEYLSRCIDSIRSQSYTDYEVILIDDGSVDASGAACDNISEIDQRFRIAHIQNHGAAYARNIALDMAKGEYVTFVDSDDYIEPEYLEKLYSALIEEETDISQCFWRRPDTAYKEIDEKPVLPDSRLFNRHEAFMDFVTDNYLCSSVWGKLYKRQLFNDICFPDMRTGEDSSVLLKIYARASRIVSISYIGYIYTMNPNGLDSTRINDINSVIVGKQVVAYAKENDRELLPLAMTKYAVFCLDAYCEALNNNQRITKNNLIEEIRHLDIGIIEVSPRMKLVLKLICRFTPISDLILRK